MYRVQEALNQDGRVYKIRPLEGTGPEKNIHRSELRVIPTKARADLNPSTILHRVRDIQDPENSGASRFQLAEDNDSEDGIVLMEPVTNMENNSDAPSDHHLNPPSPPNVSNGIEDHMRLDVYVHPTMEIANPDTVVRRSARATAGQHSNPFHLPRNVCGNVGQTNSIEGRLTTLAPLLVTFRPWV